MRWAAPLVLAACLAACGPLPQPPDTAQLPPGVFDPPDQDVSAVHYAATSFADAARTYGDPAAGAQAVLALDYLAGELNTDPRWTSIDAGTRGQLLQARMQARAAVGIAPNAPSQLVVNSLLAAHNALVAGNQGAAVQALSSPVFTKGGEGTVRALANLPYIRIANVATQTAAEEMDGTSPAATSPGSP